MAFRHVIELAEAKVEVEERAGYLLLVEVGRLSTPRDVAMYAEAIQQVVERTRIDRAVIDARSEVQGDPPVEVRDAMWAWLASERGLSKIAFVLASEMAIARVNMTALVKKAPVRAFDSVQQATRWLTRSTRSTMSLSAASSAPTEAPPAVPTAPTRIPKTPSVPRVESAGFRAPAPGPSEETGRVPRSSELRARGERKRKTTPPEGGQVA